ncbi:hypothetical protein PGQ11_010406 [Apiospora arundinis]|uniref:2EXR domain-containing protein n=1 Tax=Apiospora arundinis TaxID=335852 RepID=A0ABR2IA30_9PEZI
MLPPEIRHRIWEEALGDPLRLDSFYWIDKQVSAPVFKYQHRYCQPGERRITVKARSEVAITLGLVNHEAREVVRRQYKDLQTFTIHPWGTGNPVTVNVDTKVDMFYFLNLQHYLPALSTPLQTNPHIGVNLRHLALPLLDIALWMEDIDKETLRSPFAPSFPPRGPIQQSPCLLPGLSEVLAALPSLQTLYLVVDRLFSIPYDYPSSRSGSDLVRSRSHLHKLAESQPRDAYGFSDYDSFCATGGCLWKIEVPDDVCVDPEYEWSPRSVGDAPTELYLSDFKECDTFFRKVRMELHRLLARLPQPGEVDVRLVIDLDANVNGHQCEHLRMFEWPWAREAATWQRYFAPKVRGYDRYFASRDNARDWYYDVSGHELAAPKPEAPDWTASDMRDRNYNPDRYVDSYDCGSSEYDWGSTSEGMDDDDDDCNTNIIDPDSGPGDL